MTTRRVRLAAGGVVLTAAMLGGLGLYGLSSAIQGTDRTGDPASDPCYALSSDECRALIEQSNAGFFTKLQEWLRAIPTDEDYLRSLPQTNEVMADYGPPPPDLASAVSEADLIVTGHSTAVTFGERTTGSMVELQVHEYVKGSGPATLSVLQPSGPMPDVNWEPRLVMYPSDPLMIPGDKVLLFLRYEPSLELYDVVAFAGFYHLSSKGSVVPLSENPFADSVRGLSLEEFTAEIESVLQQSAPGSDSAR
jgi:hypothetical protein